MSFHTITLHGMSFHTIVLHGMSFHTIVLHGMSFHTIRLVMVYPFKIYSVQGQPLYFFLDLAPVDRSHTIRTNQIEYG